MAISVARYMMLYLTALTLLVEAQMQCRRRLEYESYQICHVSNLHMSKNKTLE